MPNTNPQAVRIANEKVRVAADQMGQLYNFLRALQAEATAESWLSLFANNSEVIVDGSDLDGRAPITNADVRGFITLAASYITFLENPPASSNRDLVLKIAVNPERS